MGCNQVKLIISLFLHTHIILIYHGYLTWELSHWGESNDFRQCVFFFKEILTFFEEKKKQQKTETSYPGEWWLFKSIKGSRAISLDRQLQITRSTWKMFFLFLQENICCKYSLEVPRQAPSNEYPQHMFSWRNKKNINNFRIKKKSTYLQPCWHIKRQSPRW